MSASDLPPTKAPRPDSGIRKRWIVLALILTVVVWLVFFWGVVRKSWSEEVQLGAGDLIVVERRMKLVKVYHEWPQAGLQTRFNAVYLPDGVRFETEDRIGFIRLERGPSPGTWVLIASPFYCEEFNKYGRPKPDYVQFDYANGRWTHRPVQPEYLGRAANLLVSDVHVADGTRVTAFEKRQWNSTSEGIGERHLVITNDKRAWDQRDRYCNEGMIQK